MRVYDHGSCRPMSDGNQYEGWHLKTLKCYTLEEARILAYQMNMSYFYCEYGDCYHLCK